MPLANHSSCFSVVFIMLRAYQFFVYNEVIELRCLIRNISKLVGVKPISKQTICFQNKLAYILTSEYPYILEEACTV
jgi:hypothetical protein